MSGEVAERGVSEVPESRFFRIGSFTMHAEITGNGAPLLLIHGLGSSARDWERQLPTFARDFKVIAVDLRGHGRSDKPPGPYTVLQLAADVRALLRKLEVESAHVLGLSLGGMVGFQLAIDFPEVVRSFVVVNSAPEISVRSLQDKAKLGLRLMIVRGLGMRRMGAFLAGRIFPEPHQEQERRLLEERMAENDRRAYLATLKAIVGWSVTERLEELRCPVLVITADQDYTSVETKRRWAALIPTARVVVIHDSRHATPIDQAERFNHEVLAFLEEV